MMHVRLLLFAVLLQLHIYSVWTAALGNGGDDLVTDEVNVTAIEAGESGLFQIDDTFDDIVDVEENNEGLDMNNEDLQDDGEDSEEDREDSEIAPEGDVEDENGEAGSDAGSVTGSDGDVESADGSDGDVESADVDAEFTDGNAEIADRGAEIADGDEETALPAGIEEIASFLEDAAFVAAEQVEANMLVASESDGRLEMILDDLKETYGEPEPQLEVVLPYCEIGDITSTAAYLKYGSDINTCVDFTATDLSTLMSNNPGVTYCRCRKIPGLEHSGICDNETTDDGQLKPYCSLEHNIEGLDLGGPLMVQVTSTEDDGGGNGDTDGDGDVDSTI